jgi:hypothetical protein
MSCLRRGQISPISLSQDLPDLLALREPITRRLEEEGGIEVAKTTYLSGSKA